jgi:hypothetical protein
MPELDNLAQYFDDLIDRLADPQVWPWVAGGAAALAIIIIVIAFAWLRARSRRPPPLPEMVVVDLASVGDIGPPEDGPELRCYGLGVRLAVLILAPSGRQREVPTGVERSAMIDQIVPGLAKVVAAHRTLVLIWPPQLSPRGFAHAFFTSVKLPGDRGKGTPWCSAAGKFEADGEQYMAGMALCAAKPNSLSQFVVEVPGEWLELLRVYSEKAPR